MGGRWTKKLVSLFFFLGAAALVGAVGGLFTTPNVGPMYLEAAKPCWAPPGWVFGPVWTVLYVLIALAGWRVWLFRGRRKIARPMALYGGQLFLNGLWTLLYFEFRLPWAAFFDILALLALILATGVSFFRISRFAAACFAPYALWVGFASVLNFELAVRF